MFDQTSPFGCALILAVQLFGGRVPHGHVIIVGAMPVPTGLVVLDHITAESDHAGFPLLPDAFLCGPADSDVRFDVACDGPVAVDG